MSLRAVNISQGNIGINAVGDLREFGLVCNAVEIPEKLKFNTVYKLRRLEDAKAIGLTPEYDQLNNINVYRHISEFYRIAGAGRILNIILADRKIPVKEMVPAAKTLVVEADGNISDIAFASNILPDYKEVQINGLSNLVYEAVPALQSFADWCASQDMPLHTILEGRNISEALPSLMDLRNFEIEVNKQKIKLAAIKVSLVIAQDYAYAASKTAAAQLFADVGTFLGVVASQNWNRNPGEVATSNIQNVTLNSWLVGGLSNHKKHTDVYESLETLNDKGYIIPVKYQGRSGYWFNDGHVCAPVIIDAQNNMNTHAIYHSHTMDQCIRGLRQIFLPEIKKPVLLENDGKLPSNMIEYYNAIGNAFFDKLAANGLISQGRTITDPQSDLLKDKILRVQFTVVPTGMISELVGTINLKTNM